MEEFNFDIDLDEAAMARIAHADYLEKMKDWGVNVAKIVEGFKVMAQEIVEEDELSPDHMQVICLQIPLGVRLLINQLNNFYDIMQNEAVKILGQPFSLHEDHSPQCDGTQESCGHQSHWSNDEDSN